MPFGRTGSGWMWPDVAMKLASLAPGRLPAISLAKLISGSQVKDLLALLVVSALRTERDISLQPIRRVVRHLRSRGYNTQSADTCIAYRSPSDQILT